MNYKILLFSILFFCLGALSVITIRFVGTYAWLEETGTHFHANFAIYVNGEKKDFTAAKYMEEISTCSVNEEISPAQRAHLHDKDGDSIHVHDEGVAWAHFFTNIGYSITQDILVDDEVKIYPSVSDGKKISFVLNGQFVNNIETELIRSEDRLVVDYSNDAENVILERFQTVSVDAKEYNQKNDPASCSGHGAMKMMDRVKRATFLD